MAIPTVRTSRVYTAAALALALAGCSRASDGLPSGPVVDTLASGVVRVRNPAPTAPVDTVPLSLELGSRGGPIRWGRIGDVELTPGGGIIVLDELANRVRVFDVQGRLQAAFGREGEGPREFLTPLGVLQDRGGRIWIPDSRNARYTVFDSGGALLETLPRSVRYHNRWRGAFLPDGRLLEGAFVLSTVREDFVVPGFVVGTPDRPERDTVRIPWHELPGFRPPPRRGPGTATFTPGLPFAPLLEATPDPRGFVWVGHASAYRLARLNLEGDTVGLVEVAAEALPVLREEADSALEALRAEFPSYRRVLRRSALPEQHPHFTDLQVGDDGTLWVRRHLRGEGTRFHVFDSAGIFCRAVFLPVTLDDDHTRVAYGRLAGVARDALDVERVVVAQVGAGCGGRAR